MKIGSSKIGNGSPVFICAETGTTCNGDLQTALKLIEMAKKAGADAVKFQMINPDELMSDKTVTYEYNTSGGKKSENMYEMFKSLMLTRDEWYTMKHYSEQVGITMYASVDNLPDVDLGEELQLPCYKISSWDLRNYPLIRKVVRTGKPIQVDLGPAIYGEVAQLVKVIMDEEGNNELLLMHCSHAKNDSEVNMLTISFIQEYFPCLTGYSADSRDDTADIMAITLGADVIEKRLTLNRRDEKHHHAKGLEPDEFEVWVKKMRAVERMKGVYDIIPSLEDLRQKSLYFTSIVARHDIPEGTTIIEDMLAAKRPGYGMSPFYIPKFLNKKATHAIKKDEALGWDDAS